MSNATVEAVTTTPTKRGRRHVPYPASWGENIDGLRFRKHDNRWVIVETGEMFRERDERLAVARFMKWKASKQREQIEIPHAIAHKDDAASILAAIAKMSGPVQGMKHVTATDNPLAAIGSPPPTTGGKPVNVKLEGDTLTFHRDTVDAAAFWQWLREMIITKPKFVAKMTGIEEIGFLTRLQKPMESPKLEEIGNLYTDKPGLSSNEVSRSKLFWAEFVSVVGIERLEDLNHEHIVHYEAAVLKGEYAPKSILHRYRKIRTILAYALKRGRNPEDCRRALDMTAMLEVKDANPLDPNPISVRDFWKIHAKAVKAGDEVFATLMLTALNCAMYGSEVAALKWEEIDLKRGEIVTRRSKTGVSRVAVLWPETVKALKAMSRDRDYVFNTKVRSYTIFSVLAAFKRYRTAAVLPADVVFSQIRDAAYTIACRAGTLEQAKILAGHKLGGSVDNYVRRNPQFVVGACAAIREEFYRKE